MGKIYHKDFTGADLHVPKAHKTSHHVGQSDPVDHDLLLNFLANKHIDWTNAVLAVGDVFGIKIDGATNAYTGTAKAYGIYNRRTISTPESDDNVDIDCISNQVNQAHIIDGTGGVKTQSTKAMANAVMVTAAHKGADRINEKNWGFQNLVTRSGTVKSSNIYIANYGAEQYIFDSINYDKVGGTLVLNNWAGYYHITQFGNEINGIMNVTNIGLKIVVDGKKQTNGICKNYGLHIDVDDDADETYGIYIKDQGVTGITYGIYNAWDAKSYFKGALGIDEVNPTSKLHVKGLSVYANNAAARIGGLTTGAFYRTGGEPDLVCVVHD